MAAVDAFFFVAAVAALEGDMFEATGVS